MTTASVEIRKASRHMIVVTELCARVVGISQSLSLVVLPRFLVSSVNEKSGSNLGTDQWIYLILYCSLKQKSLFFTGSFFYCGRHPLDESLELCIQWRLLDFD